MVENWKKDRVGTAENGTNPTVLCRMKSGFAVIGDTQFLKGYCVLLASPQVGSIDELDFDERTSFLADMSIIGEAVNSIYNPRRINYSILGNSDEFLHAHIFPRYKDEPDDRKKRPVWFYPMEKWTNEEFQFTNILNDEEILKLKDKIEELKGKYYC